MFATTLALLVKKIEEKGKKFEVTSLGSTENFEAFIKIYSLTDNASLSSTNLKVEEKFLKLFTSFI